MAFCPHCGKQNADDASKCTSCGKELSPAAKSKAAGAGQKFKGTILMPGASASTLKDQIAQAKAKAAGAEKPAVAAGQPPPDQAPGQPATGGPGEQDLALQATMLGPAFPGGPIPPPAGTAAVAPPAPAGADPDPAQGPAMPDAAGATAQPGALPKPKITPKGTILGAAPPPAVAPAPGIAPTGASGPAVPADPGQASQPDPDAAGQDGEQPGPPMAQSLPEKGTTMPAIADPIREGVPLPGAKGRLWLWLALAGFGLLVLIILARLIF